MTEAKTLTSTCCVCDSRDCFYHFHIPWVYKAGFVAQNVPNFNMFVSWCSDQASFNLAAKVQTCRNGKEVRLTTKSLVLVKYSYSWWAIVFLSPQTHFAYLTLLHHEPSMWKQVCQNERPDSRRIHPLCWPEISSPPFRCLISVKYITNNCTEFTYHSWNTAKKDDQKTLSIQTG